MRNLTKILIIVFFSSAALFLFLNDIGRPQASAQVTAKASPTPPDANANVGANTAANSSAPKPQAAGGDKKIPKSFTLGKDSQSEHGEVPFDHDSHAFKNYSPDGKSPIACTE